MHWSYQPQLLHHFGKLCIHFRLGKKYNFPAERNRKALAVAESMPVLRRVVIDGVLRNIVQIRLLYKRRGKRLWDLDWYNVEDLEPCCPVQKKLALVIRGHHVGRLAFITEVTRGSRKIQARWFDSRTRARIKLDISHVTLVTDLA